jgi:HPt (histidine-containing phosphotransfer) domain-containing protein
MKKRNREIQIFSLSALDLFCGAMGAFMLLALIALPYYKKNLPLQREISELRAKVENLTSVTQQLQNALQQSQDALQQAQQRVAQLQDELAQTFLVVVIAWETKADIDLHVYTPRGSHYSYESHNRRRNTSEQRPHFPAEDAELSMDMRVGGAEVWQMIKAEHGKYTIALRNFNNRGSATPTTVQGLVLYKNGSRRFTKELPQMSEDKPVLTVTIADDGAVGIDNQ